MISTLVSFLRNTHLQLPAAEVMLLVAGLSICLVFKFSRAGLIIAYIVVFRWGWMFFTKHNQEFFVIYLIFGIIVAALTILGMFQAQEK